MIEVWVTQADIKAGVRLSTVACPVAIACRRKGLAKVEVFSDEIVWHDERGEHSAETWPHVDDFIRNFDRGRAAVPFGFKIAEQFRTERA